MGHLAIEGGIDVAAARENESVEPLDGGSRLGGRARSQDDGHAARAFHRPDVLFPKNEETSPAVGV